MTDEERKALVEEAGLRASVLHAHKPMGVSYDGDLIDRLHTQVEEDGQRIAELEAALIAEKLSAVQDNQKKLDDLANLGDAVFEMRGRINTLESALKRIAGGWPKPMQLARETLEQKK